MSEFKKTNGMFDIALVKESMSMTSNALAEMSGKRHDHVLRDIETIFKNAKIKLKPTSWIDKKGEKRKQYILKPNEILLIASSFGHKKHWELIKELDQLNKELNRQIEWNNSPVR